MPDLDEQLYDEESQRQAEIELEEQRRQEMQAQQEKAGAAGQAAQTALQQGKEMVKQQVKRKIKHQILLWVASILLNPYTWLVIGLVFVAFLLAWCLDEKLECANALGFASWDLAKAALGL